MTLDAKDTIKIAAPQRSPQEIADACAREVNEVLQKHGCYIVSKPSHVPDGIGGWRLVLSAEIAIK